MIRLNRVIWLYMTFSKFIPSQVVIQEFNSKYSFNPKILTSNCRQYCNYLTYLIDEHKWIDAAKITSKIQINHIKQWQLLKNISKKLHTNIQSTSINQDNIFQILSIMKNLNYQPNIAQHQKLFYQAQKFVMKSNNNKKVLGILSLTLNLAPQVYSQYHIQNYLKKKFFTRKSESKMYIGNSIIAGIISNFWSIQFINYISQSKVTFKDQYQRYIQFGNMSIGNTISQTQNKLSKSMIELKIFQILQQLEYNIKTNIKINNFQVDYLLGSNIVLEYNGFHHYRINGQKLSLTFKDIWKQSIFEKRGFIYSSISFQQWKSLSSKQQQRFYLINKIQSMLMRSK